MHGNFMRDNAHDDAHDIRIHVSVSPESLPVGDERDVFVVLLPRAVVVSDGLFELLGLVGL